MPVVEISTDRRKLDVAFIHHSLAATYWAQGRTREIVERTIEHSICFGAYVGQRQVGFGRVVSDRAIFAYVMDVYVDPEFRGQGIGKAVMAAVLAHEDLQGVKLFVLRTRDAAGLYAQFGFVPASNDDWFMVRRDVGGSDASTLDGRN
jgi:GNAT superfamily N-acetyltransferase